MIEKPKAKAKTKRKPKPPLLAGAVFCEKVLRENDRVESAVRIHDRIIAYPVDGKLPTREEPRAAHPVLYVILKSDSKPRNCEITIQCTTPSGIKAAKMGRTIRLKERGTGVNIHVHLGFAFWEEGMYWFDVAADGVLLTRMPLHVEFSEEQPTLPQWTKTEE